MNNLVIDIQDAIESGHQSFREIAQRFEVSVNDVICIADELNDFYNYIDASQVLERVDIGF